MTRNPFALPLAAVTVTTACAAQPESRQLDVWYDLAMVTQDTATYSTVQSFRGDFHLVVEPDDQSGSRKLVLTPGYPGGAWHGLEAMTLEGHARATQPASLRLVRLIHVDGATHEWQVDETFAASEWTPKAIAFDTLASEEAAALEPVRRIELVFDSAQGSIDLDDLKLTRSDGSDIAVTDKPLDQRIAEAANSKRARIDAAFAEEVRKPRHKTLMNVYFAQLWMAESDEQLKAVNDDLHRLLTSDGSPEWNQRGLAGLWNLSPTHFLLRCYNTFSAAAEGDMAGRLEKRTEDALLQVLWDRTIHENDIYITRHSTLAMDGSENHDLDSKVASLLASKIFMEHPDWADKVLPNKGNGAGSGYWFHKDGDIHVYGPEGLDEARGDDTTQYVSKDHYEAWVDYFHRFIVDRSMSGFFLEKASGHYMTYTMGYLHDMHLWCGDAELRQVTSDLLDVIWTEWAIDQLHGVRGGAKTRYKYQPNPRPEGIRDSFSGIGQFFFGGAGNGSHNYFSTMLSNYEMPEIVWRLAFDRKPLGSYAYASRNLGESPTNYLGEPGLERTIVNSPTSRLIRYSWVTPDYILGTQMDHPGATHNHLSAAARFQGLFFAEPRGAAVYVKGIQDEKEFTSPAAKYPYNSTMVRSVQHERVAIFQGARRVLRQSPAWFPNESHQLEGMVVGMAKVQHVEEDRGWVFVQNGGAMLAIRVVEGLQVPMASGGNAANRGVVDFPLQEDHVDLVETPYKWNQAKDKLKFDDAWSPVIFEAGRLEDFGSLDAFKQYVFGNKVTLLKTVVPGFYRLRYEFGPNNENRIDFNAANLQIPRVNGEPIDYDPPYLFHSPFLNSEYQTGVIQFGLPGEMETRDLGGHEARTSESIDALDLDEAKARLCPLDFDPGFEFIGTLFEFNPVESALGLGVEHVAFNDAIIDAQLHGVGSID